MAVFAPYPVIYTPEPTSCAGGAKPGTVRLQHWITELSPWAAGLTDLGTYVCRSIAGSRVKSQHAAGRAGDDGVDTPGNLAGALLAEWLVKNHAVLGVQEVIWNRRRWSTQTMTWEPYTGVDPHTGHVHWAINRAAGADLTLARIQSVAPRPAPTPPPPDPGDDDMPAPYAFWQLPPSSRVYAVAADGITARHVSSPAGLRFAQALLKLGGHDDTVHQAKAGSDADAWLRDLLADAGVPTG